MFNSFIYVLWIVIDLALLLGAFALWGKTGILVIIASNMVMMNVFVLKGMTLFGLDATGGNVLYASIFLGTDIITEYYGEKEGRRAVLMGFFVSLFFLIATRFILLFEPADWDLYHPAMDRLFTPVWRITAVSMLAYLISQNLDVFIYGMLKKRAPKHLWIRNNGSTWISQIVDTVVFCTGAFAGVYSVRVVMGIILSTYLLKVTVAAIDTPFIYLTRPIVRMRPSILE